MSVIFTAKAEVRGVYHDELIQIRARTVNGENRPATEFRKRYFPAEINDSPCMLRIRDDKIVVPSDLKKGDWVEVQFISCEVESDVTQVYCVSIDRAKK